MTDQAIPPREAEEYVMRMPMERLSWIVLSVSFVAFCLICLASSFGLYSFLFISTMPLDIELQVGRGTTLVTNDDVTSRGYLSGTSLVSRPATVSNGPQTQSLIAFSEDDADSMPIATVTIQANSHIRVQRANQPRFRWSNGEYVITLDSFEGETDIYILDNGERNIRMRVYDQVNNWVDITRPGRYLLRSIDGRLYIDTRYGQALIQTDDGPKLISTGEEWVDTSVTSPSRVNLRRENLLDNSLFSFVGPSISYSGAAHVPSPWACGSFAEGPPSSTFTIEGWEGRQAIRFLRTSGAEAHGETFCQQSMGDIGASLQGYSYLELETTFLVNYQSLSKCGRDGSECPLMLRLRFDMQVEGGSGETETVEREWIHGFYFADDPQRDFPAQCVSCIDTHQQVNDKVWYTYRSGNLITAMQFAGYGTPVRIKDVQFYASGHDYDVLVSEIGLYRGLADVAIEGNPMPGS
ncbi:hypothetical protein G4Y79_15555 [Phototrophicus methaneseepsis]|uniref:Uncharacterized protein n=1 Tax=Phototrophicus methaneseepsis TaxID=2710758 RepID=A0A7S8IDS4_9CHLR|nr:hypothetical protein [Phototrophicus methaneseepsis]QPC81118.1 hypothetical protein G4Y79_15555 [Phototrophicus methaneseepsis]